MNELQNMEKLRNKKWQMVFEVNSNQNYIEKNWCKLRGRICFSLKFRAKMV